MSYNVPQSEAARRWPSIATAALRVAFGVVWAVGAALTFSPDFAAHYVGYLHNAAQGQPAWSAWWFNLWIALVTPRVMLFVWLTRIVEVIIALALLTGFARRSMYVVGIVFSLLVWGTAEGFGGPYSVGVSNVGTAITYVLLFVALIGLDRHRNPYSLDFYIQQRWPRWRRIAEWNDPVAPKLEPPVLPWRVQITAIVGVVVLIALLIAGLHSATHVQTASPVAAAAAVSPLALAKPEAATPASDARLPPLIGTGDSVDIEIVATDERIAIANGVEYEGWTFGGTVPGPILHVRQGQTVNVTFTNHGTMKHSLDFHAALTAPSVNYVDIDPGETIKYSFVAEVPGAFLYHCGTPPVLLHIANGMYGALIVDPATPLPQAAESFVLVQGEWYTQQVSGNVMGPDFQKMMAERADEVVFNGIAFQYRTHPLVVPVGERVRVYFVNAGPSLWTSFHVIGTIFSEVYPGGDAAHAVAGVSTYSVGPGAGAIFDLTLPEPGNYPFLDHAMSHAERGAIGVFEARSRDGTRPATPNISAAPAAPAAAPAPVPAGPYRFDAASGSDLYAARCAACHQPTGMGMPGAFPPLKGNSAVLDPDPATQIDAILHGLHGREIDGASYPAAMPGFGSLLNDVEIANIVNHERTSWGNQGKQVTADDVKARRAEDSAAQP